MIISHTKKFVMLSPWKSASQTIAKRMAEWDESPYPRFYYFNKFLNRVVHGHLTLADFNRLPESEQGYFRGAFVRNPYDRVYSGFRQVLSDLKTQPHARYPSPWVKSLVDQQLKRNERRIVDADGHFDTWVAGLREEDIYNVGGNSSLPLHPAHYWTHTRGELGVDFIGRVESFESDFIRLRECLDLPPAPTTNENVRELVGDSHNNPDGYRYVARMHAKTLDKINRLFDKDFELFGYLKYP